MPSLPLERAASLPLGPLTLGVRPEFVGLDATSALRGVVAVDEYLGASRCLHVDTPVGRLIARVEPELALARGTEVGLRFDPAHVRWFDSGSGKRRA